MPTDPRTKEELKDWPLEVGDHVTLNEDVLLLSPKDYFIIPRLRAGLGGMVREVFKAGAAVIEFSGMEYVFIHPELKVSIYRRNQNSRRHDGRDARRKK